MATRKVSKIKLVQSAVVGFGFRAIERVKGSLPNDGDHLSEASGRTIQNVDDPETTPEVGELNVACFPKGIGVVL
jgi:hypothetical protein